MAVTVILTKTFRLAVGDVIPWSDGDAPAQLTLLSVDLRKVEYRYEASHLPSGGVVQSMPYKAFLDVFSPEIHGDERYESRLSS